MAGNNPISFSDLFDFTDSGDLRRAIKDIGKLKDTYKEFLDVVVNSNMSKIIEQQTALAASARDLATASRELNITNKDAQKTLLDNAKLMGDLEKKVQQLAATKRSVKAIEDSAADSVNGLTAKLKEQIALYNKMSQSGDPAGMKKLAADIAQTRNEINQLTNATKANTAVFKAAAGSYAELDQQTKQMVKDLKNMEGGMNSNSQKARELQKQIYENTQKLKDFDKAMNQNFRNVGNYQSAFSGLNNTLQQLGITLLSLAALKEGIQYIFDTTMKFEGLTSAVKFASGNFVEADTNMKFLQDTANRLGLRLSTLTEGFKTFAGATMGTNFQGEKTRQIFEAVADAAAVMKISADDSKGVFLALGQMMSKGKVQAEELRGQLGERMSGAFRLFAEGMGKTTAELDKMLQKGQVSSEMLLPFAENLKKVYGPETEKGITGLTASVNRFHTALETTTKDLNLSNFFSGLVDGATAFIQALGRSTSYLRDNMDITVLLAGALAVLNTRWIADTAATIGNTIAKVANTVAESAKSAALAVGIAATTSYIAVTEALTGQITVATAVQRVWNAVIMANPLGAALTAITLVTAAIIHYADESENQIKIDQMKVDLNEKLEKAVTDGTDALTDFNNQIANFINLSGAERDALLEKIRLRIQETQATYDQLTAEEQLLEKQAEQLSTWQKIKAGGAAFFTGIVNPEKGNQMYQKNVAGYKAENRKAVADEFMPKINDVRTQLTNLKKDEGSVVEITGAFDKAMKTSTTTAAGLEERVRLLNIALKNTPNTDKNFKEIAKQIGLAQRELKKYDPNAIIKQFERNPKVKKGKTPEQLEKEARTAATNLAKANADLIISNAGLEFAKGAQSVTDKKKFEKQKYDATMAMLNQTQGLYAKDSVEWKGYQSDKLDAQVKYKDAITKIDDDEAKDQEKKRKERLQREKEVAQELADIERARVAAISSRNDLRDSKALGSIRKNVVTGKISASEGVDQEHSVRANRYNEEIAAKQASIQAMTKMDADYYDAQKELYDLQKNLIDENANYEIQKAQEVKDKKDALLQASFDLAREVGDSFFQISNDQIDARIQKLEDAKNKEIEMAGDNANAKKRIEEKYNKQIAEQKRKQAINDKLRAIFDIGLNTAIAISKAVAEFPETGGLPFSAIAAAIGIAQTAIVLAKPIPKYAKGRDGGPAETAIVNERGAELIEDKHGNMRIANSGKEGFAALGAGDKVHTHQASEQMLREAFENARDTDAFVDSLLHGTGVARAAEEERTSKIVNAIASTQINEGALTAAFKEAVADIPVTEIVRDAKGERRYIRTRNSYIEDLNSRQSLGGEG